MPSAQRKSARLAEVAKLAGVSTSLVSRILNEDPSLQVREETRAGVMQAVELLDYTPHASARALRNARTGLLGFALHHVNDPVYMEMVDAAQQAAADRNYSLMLLNIAELAARGESFREIVRGRRVDGLLVQSGFGGADVQLQELARTLPSVLFGADRADGLRTIRLDDQRAARMATEHLIAAGHTSIVFVGAEGASSSRRYDGYRQALAAAGVAPLPPLDGGWDADESHETALRFLSSGGKATAFVSVTATGAIGVHSGIVAAGLRIPEDISLISVHDVWFARHLNPPLTVVSLPFAELGAQAVTMLIEQLRSPVSGEVIVTEPPPQLLMRASTGSPPAST